MQDGWDSAILTMVSKAPTCVGGCAKIRPTTGGAHRYSFNMILAL